MKIYSTEGYGTGAIKCGIYGGSGTGKTMQASKVPDPIILSAESGLLSLRQHRLPYIVIDTYARLNEVMDWLLRSKEADQFKTVYMDSVSEVAEVLLQDLKSHSKDPRRAYGGMQDLMLALIRRIRDIPTKHFVGTMKELAVKDADGIISYKPSLPGDKFPQEVPYFFDEVFRAVAKKAEDSEEMLYFFRTRVAENMVAKDRSGALQTWELADLGAIFEKIRNSQA